jgi:metallo-beta-lactamase family protein
MEIQFLGAAQTVTGSMHMLRLDDGFTILLDCGLYQGREEEFEDFNKTWPFNPEHIDVLILSHAHIDHCGRIPKLVKDGFRGRIICTDATRNLASIMLQDSGKIQEDDARFLSKKLKKNIQPLYTIEDAHRCMPYFVGIGYEQWHRVCKNVHLLFLDAGHILGAASVTIRLHQEDGSDQYFGFTGDIGRPHRPILRDPVPMPPVDWLICESTYGGKTHSSAPDNRDDLLKIILHTCVEKRGKLIIPAFSVGRTQEILYMLDKLEGEGLLPPVQMYVDSPLAINATDIYLLHPECYDEELSEYLRESGHPFAFENLRYTRSREESKQINESDEPCVIISASGMASAGRVKHHIFHNIENPSTTILIVGYCAEGTLGERLVKKPESVNIFGEEKQVNAEIMTISSMSAHADQPEMIEYLSSQEKDRLKKIFLVHGDMDRQVAFREALVNEGYDHVVIPAIGDVFKLNEDE